MKDETIAELKEVFKTTVRGAVAKGGHARWGEAESLAVIEALVDAVLADEDAQEEGFDAIRGMVGQVVNPSAFAQVLEKLGTDHPSHIRRAKRGTGGSRAGAEL